MAERMAAQGQLRLAFPYKPIHSAQRTANGSGSSSRSPRNVMVEKNGRVFAAPDADQTNETDWMTDIFMFMSFASVRQ